MTEEIREYPAQAPKDCRTRLMVFGIFETLAGLGSMCLCALILAIALLGIGGEMGQMNAGGLAMSAGVYGVFGAVFLVLGIGSMLARRWARALTLVLSGIWFVFGLQGLATIMLIMPGMSNTMAAAGQAPPGISAIFLVMQIIFGGIFVGAPAILFLVYSGPHVKATCELYDPKPRWTDRCPLPVLAVVLLLGSGLASCLGMAAAFPVVPFLSHMLTGWSARGVYIAVAVLMALFIPGMYRLRRNAWRALIATYAVMVPVLMASTVMMDLRAVYLASGMPAEQVDMIGNMMGFDIYRQPQFIAVMVAGFLVQFGYLMYIRRFFAAPKTDSVV